MAADPNDGFKRLLAAEGISNFGSMLSRLALPWLATLALDATPLQMASLLVADVAAGAVGSLALGTWIDRLPKRRVMVAADLARAAVMAGLVAGAAMQWLTMALLALAAMLTGLFTVAFELARSAWVAQSIEAERLPARNARLAAVGSVSETVAFAVGGWLYQGLGAVLSLAVDATSYLLSALCLRGVRSGPIADAPRVDGTARSARPERAPGEGSLGVDAVSPVGHPPRAVRGFLAEAMSGIAVIRASRALATLAALEVLLALTGSIAGTSYIIYVTRELGFGTGALGMIFATGGLGALLGAALAPRLGSRFGSGRAMTIGLALGAIGTLCIPLAPGATILGAALLIAHQVIGDGGMTVFDVHDRTLRQTEVAPELLARVDGGLRTLGRLATLVGAIGGGSIATAFGSRTAIFLMVALLLIAAALAHHRLGRRP